MRRISFSLTERQFLDGSKTVTRRLGWKTLRPGQHLLAVRKAMGLQPGEKQVALGEIVVVSVRREWLCRIDYEDCIREGFPELGAREFVQMFTRAMGCHSKTTVTRIEFRRVS